MLLTTGCSNNKRCDFMVDSQYPVLNQLFQYGNSLREEAFNFIVGETLKFGLGVLNKSEVDLIFFSAVMKYSSIEDKSDYNLSLLLKITPSRVRVLKEKYSVKFQEINEKEMIDKFFEMCAHAKTAGKYIDIPVYDVAIKNLLENKLEEHNIVLHSQLNSKIFRLRAEDLIAITVALMSSYNNKNSDETEKELLGYIKNNKSEYKDVIKDINEVNSFKDFLERIKSMPISEVVKVASSFVAISTAVAQFA